MKNRINLTNFNIRTDLVIDNNIQKDYNVLLIFCVAVRHEVSDFGYDFQH